MTLSAAPSSSPSPSFSPSPSPSGPAAAVAASAWRGAPSRPRGGGLRAGPAEPPRSRRRLPPAGGTGVPASAASRQPLTGLAPRAPLAEGWGARRGPLGQPLVKVWTPKPRGELGAEVESLELTSSPRFFPFPDLDPKSLRFQFHFVLIKETDLALPGWLPARPPSPALPLLSPLSVFLPIFSFLLSSSSAFSLLPAHYGVYREEAKQEIPEL